jgi:hypothetical protein
MKRWWLEGISRALVGALLLAVLPWAAQVTAAQEARGAPAQGGGRIRHVLLISVDGLHARDLDRFAHAHPESTLAKLSGMGVTFASASTSRPSDSFPGLLSIVTGGGPQTTGVWYDNSYDRTLSAPGSNCATVGTNVVLDESIDFNPDALDGGGGIDPAKLPLDPAKGCTPVFPHAYLRVNTVFEAIKAAGGRTAWSDKHPAYDLVNGPSGQGVDDLYTPEINSAFPGGDGTSSVPNAEAYDDLKVQAVLNELAGKDHTGVHQVGVPAILGMNFQAVSVGQKLAGGGYTDAAGTPSALLDDALRHTDASLGKMVAQLSGQSLLASTLIVITAKHGQAPIDPSKHQIIDKAIIPGLVNGVQAGLLALATEDDVALLWLTDASKTGAVVAKLAATTAQTRIEKLLSGDALADAFDRPGVGPGLDPRTPDVIALPDLGVIYAGKSATKIAEHGGFSDDDTHVALLVAGPGLHAHTVRTPVKTTQVAPTILQALGIDPQRLQAVRKEDTQGLPGLREGDDRGQ